MSEDIRIEIIKENGNIVTIFSSKNCICDNFIEIDNLDEIQKIDNYYNSIKDNVYNKDDMNDKHLFYLQDYINNNYIDEFKKIGLNPNKINDDLVLYFLMSEFNNVILVNSSEHIDIVVIPSVGMNEIQYNSLKKSTKIFSDDIKWSMCDDMNFDIIEEDGKKYKILNVGQTTEGRLDDLIKKYDIKEKEKLV